MRNLLPLIIALIPLGTVAETPNVVTDIAPIHSLVAQVMDGVGLPDVLVSGAASPHDFQFSFIQATIVQNADLVIWAGPALTPWLKDAVDTLADENAGIELLGYSDWPSLKIRDWEDHEDHEDGSLDPHAWLNPQAAIAWTGTIGAILADMDPENSATYLANADATIARLIELDTDITTMLADVPRGAILVPHDAYQYFGARYDVAAIGAVSVGDAASPGPAHIEEMRALVRDENVVCVLTDPQSRPAWVELVREGSDARTAMADPMGTAFAPGPDHYDQTLRAIAAAYFACLGG